MVAKEIFTGEFIAFSDFDRKALRSVVDMAAAKRVLELGSWLGNGSTKELASLCSEVYCVDHWQGNPNVFQHQKMINDFDVFATFQRNTECFGNKIRPMLMSSGDAANVIADESFDLVFIDADHSYTSTLTDIKRWRSKVKPGGILCGHDCEGRPDDFGRSTLENSKQFDTIESTKFPKIHPGSILAVDEAFRGAASLFAETELQLADGRNGFSTIWYMKI